MNKKSKLLITLLPIMALCFVLCTNISYADVRVNITEEKTEPYSNSDDTNTVTIDLSKYSNNARYGTEEYDKKVEVAKRYVLSMAYEWCMEHGLFDSEEE